MRLAVEVRFNDLPELADRASQVVVIMLQSRGGDAGGGSPIASAYAGDAFDLDVFVRDRTQFLRQGGCPGKVTSHVPANGHDNFFGWG